MKNNNCIEILNADFLNDQAKLNEIDHWIKVMNRPQGWHYDMDIIWLLTSLEEAGIKKGDTILDAGAGMGITQFLLAAKGYNIISLDFSPRLSPIEAEGIFEIKVENQDKLDYKHDYMGFVLYGLDKKISRSFSISFLTKILKVLLKGPFHFYSRFKYWKINKKRAEENQRINQKEKQKNHDNFGTIRFLRAAFHEIPIETATVDALVSVSAIEHADKKLLNKNINEMKRVVQKNAPLFITTSATLRSEDWFHKKTKGWCFTFETLKKIVSSSNTIEKNDLLESEKNIIESSIWQERIDSYYAEDINSDFYGRKVKTLPYLPVGLKIINE